MINIPDSFEFNESVSNGFDDHVREQLPWYDLVTDLVCHIAKGHLGKDSSLLDIGCSTGNITHRLKPEIKDRNITTESIDSSPYMASKFKGNGELIVDDICTYHLKKYDVVVSMLSLMFIDISKRSLLIRRLKESLNPGGVLIIVDKLVPKKGYSSLIASKFTIVNKLKTGVSASEVIKKEVSLIGVQRPFDNDFFEVNEFVEFFRLGDFVGVFYEGEA